MPSPTVNNYLDQVRFRAQNAEAEFETAVKSLHGSQAAKGLLRSGATIKKSLDLLAADFDRLTDELLAYLAKTLSRTELDRSELLGLTAQILQSSKAAFSALIRPALLRSFAPSKSIDAVIDAGIASVGQRLTLRLQEFAFGLDDHTPTSKDFAVTNNINIGSNFGNVQQGTRDSSQTMTVSLDAGAIKVALEQFDVALAGLPESERAKMMPDLIALRAQASKPSLSESVVKEIGKSLRGVAEGIAGNLATPAFVTACAALWSALGIG
ncbi:MAG: hypothetical protein R3C27_12940 [Hyphomonadaceae bacterium]